MKIGAISIDHPFVLAPMAGITNSPYRRLMRGLGSAFVVSELVSANGLEYASQRTLDLLQFNEEERPVGLQIFGEDEERLCRAAKVIEAKGADFVDLNLGCPVPKVVKKGAGSAMCRDPIGLGKILTAMVKSVSIPVTIKIRTGWDSQTRNAHEVIQAATDAGVAIVGVHGRTRAQGYSGVADWDFIGDLKAKAKIPIIGNGDILTATQAVEKVKIYGVDAVYIGRAALRNPFIFEQARAIYNGRTLALPDSDRYVSLLIKQRALLSESYDARMSMIHSKKFLSWYSSGFPGCHEFRKKVFTSEDPAQLWEMAENFFRVSTENRDLSFLNQPFLMGGHG